MKRLWTVAVFVGVLVCTSCAHNNPRKPYKCSGRYEPINAPEHYPVKERK